MLFQTFYGLQKYNKKVIFKNFFAKIFQILPEKGEIFLTL